MLSNSVIIPEELPPSEQAACYHGFRVHLQIIQWKMLDETEILNPTDCDWKRHDGHLVRVPTDKDVALANLL